MRGRPKVDRRAVAEANGYFWAAHRENDSNATEKRYSDDTIKMKYRILEEYRK